MPTFTNEPPHDDPGYSLPIVRTPPGRKLRAVITSEDIIGCNTHFWGGHTVPCDPPDCEACLKGVPYRWHAYCAILIEPSKVHAIYETTAQAAEKLVEYRREHSTLRNCIIEAYRWAGRFNGRVIIRTAPNGAPQEILPPAPDLLRILATIWQIPYENLTIGPRTEVGKPIDAVTKIPGQHQPSDPR